MAFEMLPYTNFHDLNLDWILEKVKEMIEAKDTVITSVNTATEAAETATAAADVATEKSEIAQSAALDATAAKNNAEISANAAQAAVANIGTGTAGAVADWLTAHVDPDTGYVIDDSLTIEGAAADALATGIATGGIHGLWIENDQSSLLTWEQGTINNSGVEVYSDTSLRTSNIFVPETNIPAYILVDNEQLPGYLFTVKYRAVIYDNEGQYVHKTSWHTDPFHVLIPSGYGFRILAEREDGIVIADSDVRVQMYDYSYTDTNLIFGPTISATPGKAADAAEVARLILETRSAIPQLDYTLTVPGMAADAKATGDAINNAFAGGVEEAVNEWLDEHPEATTTVEDHSLTNEKLVPGTLGYITPQMYGAVGDGVTNDTTAWNNFQSDSTKLKMIPAGEYLVNESVIKFNKNIFGGDNFDITNRWNKTLIKSRNAVIQIADTFDIENDLSNGWDQSFASFILQKHMRGDRDLPPSNMFVVGQHIDLILDGAFTHAYEPGSVGGNNSPNYTAVAVTANSRMSGNIGVTGFTARIRDLPETENTDQLTNGVAKIGGFYAEIRRNTRYDTVNKDIGVGGSYGLGMETYLYWDSDEDTIYSREDDFGDYKSWMCGYHCTSASSNLPITVGIMIDALSSAASGFYSAIAVGGSSMRIGNNNLGASGTVGLDFSSWGNTSYGETAIRYGYAHRHQVFDYVGKISAPSMRIANESGTFVLGVGSSGNNPAGIQFFGGANYNNILATDSGITTYGTIRVDAAAFYSLATTKFRWTVQSGNTTGHIDLTPAALLPIETQNLGSASYKWGSMYGTSLVLGNTTLSEVQLQSLLALI